MGLSQRERVLIVIAFVVLLPLLIFRFVILPINQHQQYLANSIESLKSKIEQTTLIGQELSYLKKTGLTRPISLSKKIDSILRQEDLKSRSRIQLEENPKGGQRLVLRVDEINLTELTQLIYKIENSKPVVMIDNIDIGNSYKNKKLFRVSMALISK
jgi:hypothetical protein